MTETTQNTELRAPWRRGRRRSSGRPEDETGWRIELRRPRSSGEPVVERKLPKLNWRHPTGVKLGSYDGSSCLQTFLARFENYPGNFEWDEANKLFQLRPSLNGAAGQILWDAGKQSTVGRVVALLRARFGSEN